MEQKRNPITFKNEQELSIFKKMFAYKNKQNISMFERCKTK
jgi:hypothetical protein